MWVSKDANILFEIRGHPEEICIDGSQSQQQPFFFFGCPFGCDYEWTHLTATGQSEQPEQQTAVEPASITVLKYRLQ